MDRNKKATPYGWLIFGFAFVAPALLPVILTLNFGALGSSGPQPPSAASEDIVWIHFRGSQNTKLIAMAKCYLLAVAPALLPVI